MGSPTAQGLSEVSALRGRGGWGVPDLGVCTAAVFAAEYGMGKLAAMCAFRRVSRRWWFLGALLNRCSPVACALTLSACASVKVCSFSEDSSLRPLFPASEVPLRAGGVSSLNDHQTPPSGKPPRCATMLLSDASGRIRYSGQSPSGSCVQSKMGGVISGGLENGWPGNAGKNLPVGVSSKSRGVLVTGQLWDEDPGSRALRILVGLGAGRSRLSGRFCAYNLDKSSSKPWLTVYTEGGSGREPGAIWSLVPGPYMVLNLAAVASAAVVSGSHMSKGLSQDASRTSKTLSLFIASRMPSGSGVGSSSTVPLAGSVNLPFLGRVRAPLAKRSAAFGHTFCVGDR